MNVSTRRLSRGVAMVCAAVVGVLVAGQPPALADDGLRLTVEYDGRGSVWVTAAGPDGRPTGDPVAATISARESAGRTLTPQPLQPAGAPGNLVYLGRLPDGEWTVNVVVTSPGRTTCVASLAVGPTAESGTVPCDGVAPGPADTTSGWTYLALIGVLALAAGMSVALVWLHRARTIPAPPLTVGPDQRRIEDDADVEQGGDPAEVDTAGERPVDDIDRPAPVR